jgi:hypothetical protein
MHFFDILIAILVLQYGPNGPFYIIAESVFVKNRTDIIVTLR